MSSGDNEDDQYGSSDFEQDSHSSLLEVEESPQENEVSDNKANSNSNSGSKLKRAVCGGPTGDYNEALESVQALKCVASPASVQTEEVTLVKPSVDAKPYSALTNSEHDVLQHQLCTCVNKGSIMSFIPPIALNQKCHDKAESMEACSLCDSTLASSESFISRWNYGVKEKNTWENDSTSIMDNSTSWVELDHDGEEKDVVGFSKDSKVDPFPLLADLKRTIKEIQAEIPGNVDGSSSQEIANTALHIEGAIIEARDLPFNRIVGGNTFVRLLYVSPGPGHIVSRSKKNLHQTNLAASSPHPSWNSPFSSICSGKAKGDLIFALYTVINNENYFIGQAQVKTSPVQSKTTQNRRNIFNWFPLSSWSGERLEAGAAILLKLDIYTSRKPPLSGLPVMPLFRTSGGKKAPIINSSGKLILPLNDITATVRERHRLHKTRERQMTKKRIDEENANLWKRITQAKNGKSRPVSAPYNPSFSPASHTCWCRRADTNFATNELNIPSTADEFHQDELSEKVKDASKLLATISGEVEQLLKQI